MSNPSDRPCCISSFAIFLGVAAVYAVVARLSFLFTIPPGNISPVFPAAGLALAAAMIWGRKALIGVWFGSFAANAISFLGGSVSPVPAKMAGLLMACSIGFGALSGAAVGAFLVRRLCGGNPALFGRRNVLILVGVGAVVCGMISPTFGVLSLTLGGGIPWARFGYSWITWWAGDASGILIAAPLILAWQPDQPSRRSARRNLEMVVLGGATLLVCFYVFFRTAPFEYGLLPLLFWAAFRFGMRGATVTAAAIALFATVGASRGTSPFAGATVNESLLLLNSFFGVAFTSSLFVAGMKEEQKRAERALRQSETTLRSVFKAAPVGICVLKDRVFQSGNAVWFEIVGYHASDLIGQTPRRLYDTIEEYERVGRELYANLSKHGSSSVETRLRCGDGSCRDVIVSAALLDPSDPSAGDIVAVHDITGRKRVEAALRESERRYRELVEHAGRKTGFFG